MLSNDANPKNFDCTPHMTHPMSVSVHAQHTQSYALITTYVLLTRFVITVCYI